MRVMLVEDNAALAAVLRFNLERVPVEVSWAPDGKTARRLLEEQVYDLVITDYQLPDASGAEVMEALRNSPLNKECPLILLTAKARELDLDGLCHEFKVLQVIGKPFSPRSIVELVRQVGNAVAVSGSETDA